MRLEQRRCLMPHDHMGPGLICNFLILPCTSEAREARRRGFERGMEDSGEVREVQLQHNGDHWQVSPQGAAPPQ